jgi:hypothetical protein
LGLSSPKPDDLARSARRAGGLGYFIFDSGETWHLQRNNERSNFDRFSGAGARLAHQPAQRKVSGPAEVRPLNHTPIRGCITIGEYGLAATGGIEHVRSLSTHVAKLAASVRTAIREADKPGDPTTADVFAEASRALDKDLWLLESHLQANQ